VRRLAAFATGLVLAGCGGTTTGATNPTAPLAVINVSSPAFAPGGTIPREYTCDGRDVSPPLRWSGVPKSASELTVVMRDPDAPGGVFVHWNVRMPATVKELATGQVPTGAVQGQNGFGRTGYGGPCPPRGDPPHHYVITVSAVGASSGGTVLATGTLTGTYARR
jgi:Raf kinase inhibitor-like YbhB/YbcL family protein